MDNIFKYCILLDLPCPKNPAAIIIDDDKETVEIFSEYMEMINVNLVGKGYNGKTAVDLYVEKPELFFWI